MKRFVLIGAISVVLLAAVDIPTGVQGPKAEWRATVSETPPPLPKLTYWSNHVRTDPMTDKETSTWTAFSRSTIRDSIGRQVTPRLIARCHNGKTELIVHWARFITTGDLFVTHRIGSKPMDQTYWSVSTDFEAMFAGYPIDMLKAMRSETRFLVETIPYSSSAVRAEFALDGVDQVIDDISRRCEWTTLERPAKKAEWRCAARDRFGACTGYVPAR